MTVHLSARQYGPRGPRGHPVNRNRAWLCSTCGRENPPGSDQCRTIGCPGPQAGAGGHRTGGYAKRKPAWICIVCRAYHEVRPRECIDPACTNAQSRKETRFLFCDSKVEALRFLELWAKQDHGEIANGTLVHHPRFELCTPDPQGGPPVVASSYTADSSYRRASDGVLVVEDVKPERAEAIDPVFRLKRRWFEAQYAPTRITLVS